MLPGVQPDGGGQAEGEELPDLCRSCGQGPSGWGGPCWRELSADHWHLYLLVPEGTESQTGSTLPTAAACPPAQGRCRG